MPKKILIVSGSTGSGHVRAGEALRKTAQILYPKYEIRHVDFFDFLSAKAKKNIIDAFQSTTRNFPELWKIYFHTLNTKAVAGAIKKIFTAINNLDTNKFATYVDEWNPDIMISTHIPSPGMLHNYKNTKMVRATVVTDYMVHRLWINHPSDYYFVATAEMKSMLMKEKINSKKIIISGIPIDPIFYKKISVAEIKDKYQLPKNVPILLVLSGGQGLIDISTTIKNIFASKHKITIIAVAGDNKALENKLHKLKTPANISLMNIGWTDHIDELMRVADVIISKPGGLTTTECIALGKPLIIINPIPGQEDANAKFILDNSYGTLVGNAEELNAALDFYLNTKNKLTPLPASGPTAAEIILQTLVAVMPSS